MRHRYLSFLFLMALGAFTAPGAVQERLLSVALTGSYTTSSKTFFHPDDPDEFLRGQYFPIDHIAGVGIDVRRTFSPGTIALGLSVELLDRLSSITVPLGGVAVHVEDGYRAIPIELSGYCFLPVGTREFRLYMGGGAGVYLGERRYAYAGVRSAVKERGVTGGIHVLTGVEWRLSDLLSLRSEVRFRNVQLSSVNVFRGGVAIVDGTTVPLPVVPLSSRISIDGMNLAASLAFHW